MTVKYLSPSFGSGHCGANAFFPLPWWFLLPMAADTTHGMEVRNNMDGIEASCAIVA